MILLILALNIVGWPVIHLVLSYFFTLCPDEYFTHDSWVTRRRRFELDGQLYRQRLAVQRWKGWLPDGAPWLGGKSKRRIESRSHAHLNAFMIETRRAEMAHWCMLLCTPVFCLWNPAWACIVMSCYGIAANLPCIVAQRANRIKIARILNRRRTQSASRCDRRTLPLKSECQEMTG